MLEWLAFGLRLVVYLTGGTAFALSLWVAWRHLQAWRHSPGKRLLPLHVWMIATSYALLLLTVLTFTGTPSWRIAFYGPALPMGAAAMLVMFRRQQVEADERDDRGREKESPDA